MNIYFTTILGISIIFLCTTIGSSVVFFFRKKEISHKIFQISNGFAAGIMLSASIFSLIIPAMEYNDSIIPGTIIAIIGILLGSLFMFGIDRIVPHLHITQNEEEGLKTQRINKITKMFLAVTIHNIPEGLSVGIAYGVALSIIFANQNNAGSAEYLAGNEALMSALFLAIGIGIQNIPEGATVSLPILSETGRREKAFAFGVLSGAVEPVAALIGLFLSMILTSVMPWALSFAGGCMIYVIVEEMVPDAQSDPTNHFGVFSFIIGFVLMIFLDTLHF